MELLTDKPLRNVCTLELRKIYEEIFYSIGYGEINTFGNPYHKNHDYSSILNIFRDKFEDKRFGYSMTILEETEKQSHIVFGLNTSNGDWSALVRLRLKLINNKKIYSFNHLNLRGKLSSDDQYLMNTKAVTIFFNELQKVLEKKSKEYDLIDKGFLRLDLKEPPKDLLKQGYSKPLKVEYFTRNSWVATNCRYFFETKRLRVFGNNDVVKGSLEPQLNNDRFFWKTI